jgi:hypothetical protein
MTASLASQARPSIFGGAALCLALLGWLWFALCFTARTAAWWNSLYFFAGIYIAAILIAIRASHLRVISGLHESFYFRMIFVPDLFCIEHKSSNPSLQLTAGGHEKKVKLENRSSRRKLAPASGS